MRALLEILKLSTEYLASKGIDHARREAEWAVCDALEIDRLQLYLDFDRPLNDKEVEKVRKWIQRRGEGEPLAYIRGFIEFYGCQLKITRDVLIPRQETEILVDHISKVFKKSSLKGMKLLDLCTGSGCIGLALKKHFPDLTITLTDISEKAILLAKQNSANNKLDVEILQGDLFEPIQVRKFDYITCNPPYISENEYQTLDREVRQFEPTKALIAGPSGLEFYEKIGKLLPLHLNPKGSVWMEIGASQGKAVLDLFLSPCWIKKEVLKDWSGHDRFISLEIE